GRPGLPVNLTPQPNVYMNMDFAVGPGSRFHSLHLNAGPNDIAFADRGAGGGLPAPGYELATADLEPDLTIVHCRVSQPFAAPGSRVRASVRIENHGLVPNAVAGDRAAGLEAVYVADDGRQTVMATSSIPLLEPGDGIDIELALEMPHDPVRLRVQLSPNPADLHFENNARECFFGAPSPEGLQCELVTLTEAMTRAHLMWTSPALYDEILVYRDRELIAALPGGSVSFVDQYLEERVEESAEQVEYSVRGRIATSKSVRASCFLRLQPEEPDTVIFLRGDASEDGRVNINDGIFTFNYLFSGGRTPACLRSADANASGVVDVTDGIYVLNYLFGTGREPPAPFPECAAAPADADALECEPPEACQER
ncbi:MAG: hypothetical protein ACREQY_09610, partial [Candidatus Binatia bacterium]